MRARFLFALSFALAGAVGCGSSGSDSSGGSGPTPNKGGAGGGIGMGGGSGSGASGGGDVEDLGYASEPAAAVEIPAPTSGPPKTPVATVCGEYDTTEVNQIHDRPTASRVYASATRSRELIGSKQAPISPALRTDDHLNYYRVGAFDTQAGNALVPNIELRQLSIAGQLIPKRYQLFVGISAGPVAQRPPVAMTVLVDTTPSMTGEPLERARASVRAIADALHPGDHLIVMNSDQVVLFDGALSDPASETKGLEQKLDVGGEAQLRVPLEVALEKAAGLAALQQWTRLVLISDGQGDPNALPKDAIMLKSGSGVHLDAVGVGGSFVVGDAFLFRASQLGGGSYVYIDSLEEPKRILQNRFDQVFGTAYEDLTVTLDLPWFLRALDQPDVSATADAPIPQSLPPNGTASFVYSLESCHEMAPTKYGPSYQIKVGVSFVNASDGIMGSAQGGMLVSEMLKLGAPHLDQVLAAEAYVSALRAPTKSRFQDAFDQLKPLMQPGNAFEEMYNLLDAYPKKP